MFSSISKYSPKKLLASYLSKSLAEFFCVDPERVETNLLQDARVVLNDIEIKEQQCGGILVSGSVQKIEFSWTWDTVSLISNVNLTIQGVVIHVNFVKDDESNVVSTTSSSSLVKEPTANDDDETKEAPDWKAKYLQQIIDNLTLMVTDVTIAIHIDETSQIILQGKDMELRTLTTKHSLLQNISLASIEAWIEETNNIEPSSKYPILEPFGYNATVRRVSGRRFLDGLMFGLFVQGASQESSTIRLHAGVKQIAGLNHLQQVLLTLGLDIDNNNDDDDAVIDMVNSDKNNELQVHEASSPPLEEIKSIFHLPFRSIEVVLENNTALRLLGCSVRYCTDGTEFWVDCNEGIWMDDKPLSKNNRWILDLVSSEIVMADSLLICESDKQQIEEETDKVFQLDLSIEMFKRVYSGIHSILPQCEEAMTIAEKTMERNFKSTSSKPWKFYSKRKVAFRFTGEGDTWVLVSANLPSLLQGGSESFFSLDCKSIGIESNAGFSIDIPHIYTEKKSLLIEDSIKVSIQSLDTIKVLQDLWNEVNSILEPNASTTSSRDVPIDTSIPSTIIKFGQQRLDVVYASGISASGAIWKFEKLEMIDVKGLTTEATEIKVALDANRTTITVGEIIKLHYEQFDYLQLPLSGTKIVIEDDTISLASNNIQLWYPEQITEVENKEPNSPQSPFASIPFSLIKLKTENFSLKSGSSTINAKCIDVTAKVGEEESLFVTVEMAGIDTSINNGVDITCGRVQTSLQFDVLGDSKDEVSDNIYIIPQLGALSSADLSVYDITKISIDGIGHLVKPLDIVNIEVHETETNIRFNTVLFCLPGGSTSSTEDKFDVSSDININRNFSIDFEIKRLVLMPEYGAGKPGVCFDGLSGKMLFNHEEITFDTSCNYFQGRGENQASFAIKGIRLKMCKTLKHNVNKSPNIYGIHNIELNMIAISSFHLPGIGKITKEISGATLEFGTNGFVINFDTLEWSNTNSTTNTSPSVSTDDNFNSSLFEHPFEIMGKAVKIKTESNNLLCFEKMKTVIKGDSLDTPLQVDVQMKALYGDGYKGERISGQDLNMMVSIIRGNDDNILVPENFSIPSVGHVSSIFLRVSEISEMNIPDLGKLSNPTTSFTLQFDNANGINLVCPEISIIGQETPITSTEDQNKPPFDLPCKMNTAIESFKYFKQASSDKPSKAIECGQISLALDPVLAQIGTSIESPGSGVYFSCKSLKALAGSTVLEIPSLTASGLVQFDKLQNVGNLAIGIETMQLSADFSRMNWSESLQTESSDEIALPFAVISNFDLTLKFVSTLVNLEGAVIACDRFEGEEMTTLDSISSHYLGIVTERIPYLLAKTNVAGKNLGDGVGMTAGIVLTNTSVVGATIGVAARDAVGSALTQGKAARGASSTEKYKFGDFTRGMLASVKSAAKSGAEMRGDDSYLVGDVTVGTARAAGTYASENRVRLSGAAGSTAGMVAGAALLGPVGFVAGAMLGGSAAQSSMRAVAGDPKEKSKQDGQTQSSENSSSDLYQQNRQAVDLLSGDGNYQSVPNDIANQNSSTMNHATTTSNLTPIPTSANAEVLGEVASADHRVVMVQAQVIESSSSNDLCFNVPSATTRDTNSIRNTTMATTMSDPLSSSLAPLTGSNSSQNSNSRYEASTFERNNAARSSSNNLGLNVPSATTRDANLVPSANMARAMFDPLSSNLPPATGSNSRYEASAFTRNNVARAQPEMSSRDINQPLAHNQMPNQTETGQQGYRFGDITRGIAARGAQNAGRDPNSGYKFGDFTRGLFG